MRSQCIQAKCQKCWKTRLSKSRLVLVLHPIDRVVDPSFLNQSGTLWSKINAVLDYFHYSIELIENGSYFFVTLLYPFFKSLRLSVLWQDEPKLAGVSPKMLFLLIFQTTPKQFDILKSLHLRNMNHWLTFGSFKLCGKLSFISDLQIHEKVKTAISRFKQRQKKHVHKSRKSPS